MVVTGKARSKIRSSMKEERRRQGGIGKEALGRKLKSMKAGFEDNVDVLVKYFDLNSFITCPLLLIFIVLYINRV